MRLSRLCLLSSLMFILSAHCQAQIEQVWIINSETIYDPVKGITRIIRARKSVDTESESCLAELNQMSSRLDRLTSDVIPIPTTPDESSHGGRKQQAEVLRKQIEEKQRVCSAAYNRRFQEILKPILADITRSLDAFTKRRGIKLLLDTSRATCFVACQWGLLADKDITEEFIEEYNRLEH